MWGPPGSGKTSAVWQMAQYLIKEKQGIIIFISDPQVAIWCLTALRRIEPHRPIVTVAEDLDALVLQHGEHYFLSIYDGEYQLNNVVHLATTNYPDRLDRRFIDRPSRFDTIKKVGMPSEEARRVYLQIKEPALDEMTVERWVQRSDGYSVAHLREVCIATQCLRQPEDEVFARLDKMRQLIELSSDGDDERDQVGFVPRSGLVALSKKKR
jgi:SpoVK/Ycf46/Vps4 family AAA+-type ATPase